MKRHLSNLNDSLKAMNRKAWEITLLIGGAGYIVYYLLTQLI